MTSLDILHSSSLNLKNKSKKIEHKKTSCGPSKILKNISRPINICPKYLMASTKTLPSNIINVRSLRENHDFNKFWIFFIILAAHVPTFIPTEAIWFFETWGYLLNKMPWVKAISVQRNVNTTFKFIHFYYNILYAIEKLWFHSVSFHFIENCHVKGFYLSFLISIKILLSTWKMLSQKLLQSSGY